MDNEIDREIFIQDVTDGAITPFIYLKYINEFLSNPKYNNKARDLIIRALDNIDLFSKNIDILQNLVRKSGLYPYLNKYFSINKIDDKLAIDLYKSNFKSDFIFHSVQMKIFNLIMDGENVVLSAPTSMGKSAIVDSLIAECKFQTIVIIVPTIALIDETRKRIEKKFHSTYQIIFHSLQDRYRDRAVYILTQERVNERTDLNNVDLFILDEFYKLSYENDDNIRVESLNIAFSKLISISKQFYLIGPYINGINGFDILNRDFVFIPSDFNTVSLNIYEYNINPNNLEEKNKKLLEILSENRDQTIIYCKSQSSISKAIKCLINNLNYESKNKKLENNISSYISWVSSIFGEDWGYLRALKNGFGIHHGSLPRCIQQKTIELFNNGSLNLLFCTSTLIEGVNTSAKNIIIYDNRNGNSKISKFTHKNISGRAGRMNKYLIGNVFCLETVPSDNFSSQIVDLPLGKQDDSTPLNLLAGIQKEHLTEESAHSLSDYWERSVLTRELILNNSSYHIDAIEDGYKFIEELSDDEIKAIVSEKPIGKYVINILSKFLKLVNFFNINTYNMHYDDSAELSSRMAKYLYSDNHTSYLKSQIRDIYTRYKESEQRSFYTDRELKIIRNVYRYTIPRGGRLFSDLINFSLNNRGIEKDFDINFFSSVFEYSHLPAPFIAVEEMGVPISILEKIYVFKLDGVDVSVDFLVRYIRMFHKKFKFLTELEIDLIEKSLI